MNKNIRSIAAVLLVMVLAAFSFTACNKLNTDDVVPGSGIIKTPPSAGGRITGSIDGLGFKSQHDSAYFFQGYFRIQGVNVSSGTIGFNISNIKVGTYILSDSTSLAAIGTYQTATTTYTTSYPGCSGQIIISAIDSVKKTITGTFTMKVADANANFRVITNGVINQVSYSSLRDNPNPAGGSDTLSAKINGTSFKPTQINATDGAINPHQILISGFVGTTIESMNLYIADSVATGNTYILSTLGSGQVSITYNSAGGTTYLTDDGTMTITKHDKVNKHIEGFFNFNGKSSGPPTTTVTVTDGLFKADY